MKEIKSVGLTIPSNEDDFLELQSNSSLSDADLVVFSANFNETNYSTYDTNSFSSSSLSHEGKDLYNQKSSSHISEHAIHWNKELDHFLESGGTLFLSLCEKKDFYIYSGSTELSGTGRNQKTIKIVQNFSNYNYFINFSEHLDSVSGHRLKSSNPIYAKFLIDFKDFISFTTYIKPFDQFKSEITTLKGDRILGGSYKYKNGHIVFLPKININNSNFWVEDDDNEEDEGHWSDEALKLGRILKKFLKDVDKSLKNEFLKSEIPDWLCNKKYELIESKKTEDLIKKNSIKIDKIMKENKKLQIEIDELNILKDLLFETGKALEVAVIKGLNILGFKAENFDDGELELDQIIISPEGIRYIGECEGKDNKDIDISKFRQLQDGLNADFERDEVDKKAYGLLIGNSKRSINPLEREGLGFTKKCINGAERERIGLIKTIDLFYCCQYILNSKDTCFANKCRSAIQEQLGTIIKFPDIDANNVKI